MIPILAVAGSDVSISRCGFGCGRIFGGRESKASAQLIEAALVAGMYHFDTAPSYGDGQSEAVLGAVLAGVPDITIATKIGIPRPESPSHRVRILYRRLVRPVLSRFPATKARLVRVVQRRGIAGSACTAPRQLGRDEVLRGLEDSLRQLRRSRVDLYLIHEPDQFELTEDLQALFATLKRDRTIGSFGLAWGRVADACGAFGTVIQGRYDPHLPTRATPGRTRIFHGVLRREWRQTGELYFARGLGDSVREVLETHPDSAVIFSASTPSQIREVAEKLDW
jgi:aryl-alcohol dehydrogenase-like predicted oxidoreductase